MRSMDIVRTIGADIVPYKAKPAHKAAVGKQIHHPHRENSRSALV